MAPQVLLESIVQQPLFRTYFFYVSILSLKILFMAALTGIQRFKHKAFINLEDAEIRNVKIKIHEDVERVRRAHLNDLENIPVFFIVALIYLTTNPSVFLATTLIRVFTIARFVHTFVYAMVVIPQPARALTWSAGYFITIYMALSTILYYLV